jgi:hypothetical protein
MIVGASSSSSPKALRRRVSMMSAGRARPVDSMNTRSGLTSRRIVVRLGTRASGAVQHTQPPGDLGDGDPRR